MQPPSRRTFLALGLLTLTGCTSGADDSDRPGGAGATPDPDVPVRLRAVAATDALLAAQDAQLAAGGPQTALIQRLHGETIRHRAALADTLPAGATGASSGPATGTPGPTTASGSPAPGATPAAPATPAAAARQAAQALLAELGAAGPDLARLLASVAAADLLQAADLGDTTPPAAPPTASPSPSAGATAAPGPAPAAALTALQGALGAEHAAVYGYGVVGARLPDDQQRADARTALAAHEARRDAWQRLVTGLGATPAPAAAGYQLPFPVTDPAAAGRLAAHLETQLTTVYADLVAALPAPHRPAAAAALHECAVRARRWGAPGQPFPGIAEPAPTAAATPSATATGAPS